MALEDFEKHLFCSSKLFVFEMRPGWHWSIQIEGLSSQTNETQNNF